MLNTFPFAITVGTIFGYLAGIGIGGGSLLILWLTWILNTPQQIARAINLLFFLFAAGSATLIRWKKGDLHPKRYLPTVFAGCVAAIFGTWLSMHIDVSYLKKPFGIFLIITGIRELFYRPTEFR